MTSQRIRKEIYAARRVLIYPWIVEIAGVWNGVIVWTNSQIEDEGAFMGNVVQHKYYEHKGSARRELSDHRWQSKIW